MKLLAIDWSAFYTGLPLRQRLSVPARQVFLEQGRPAASAHVRVFGESLGPLLQSGFLVHTLRSRESVKVAEPYRDFLQVVKAMSRHRLFDGQSPPDMMEYLLDHFTGQQLNLLGDRFNAYGNWRAQVATRAGAKAWLDEFLQVADPVGWVRNRLMPNESQDLGERKRVEGTRALLTYLMEQRTALRFEDLRHAQIQGVTAEMLPLALYCGFRQLLFFPALRSEDLAPVVGIWPAISARLHRPGAALPAPVKPTEIFHLPYLREDMAIVMAECVTEPMRVRGHDFQLFAKAAERIASAVPEIPEWVVEVETSGWAGAPEERIHQAIWTLSSFKFVETRGTPGKDLRLMATQKGREWLDKPPKEQLRVLLDHLKDSATSERKGGYYDEDALAFLPMEIYYYMSQGHRGLELHQQVAGALAGLGQGEFVPLEQFLEYQSRKHNPLLEQGLKKKTAMLTRWGMTMDNTEEQLEESWSELLRRFLAQRLIPLGGIELGKTSGGELCFALTEIGRYLLGASRDFAYGHEGDIQVVIQPNFEVVFLTPSPATEAMMARFAERRGRGIGVLFRITRKSILGAARSGMKATEVLEFLRGVAQKGVPANVEREISGWTSQVRTISLRPAVLIHCPDVETASQVRAAGGKNVEKLTDTVIELCEPKFKAALLRRLRESGIFPGESSN